MKKLSQADRLKKLLEDGKPHNTPEIQAIVYGGTHLGTARIASRVHDLRAKGLHIEGWKDAENPAIFWYQMDWKPKPKLVPVTIERDGRRFVRMVEEGSIHTQGHE